MVIEFNVNLPMQGNAVLCVTRNFFNLQACAIINLAHRDSLLNGQVVVKTDYINIEFTPSSDNSDGDVKVTCTAVGGNSFGALMVSEIQRYGNVSYTLL